VPGTDLTGTEPETLFRQPNIFNDLEIGAWHQFPPVSQPNIFNDLEIGAWHQFPHQFPSRTNE
jgi:hypothetical protein